MTYIPTRPTVRGSLAAIQVLKTFTDSNWPAASFQMAREVYDIGDNRFNWADRVQRFNRYIQVTVNDVCYLWVYGQESNLNAIEFSELIDTARNGPIPGRVLRFAIPSAALRDLIVQQCLNQNITIFSLNGYSLGGSNCQILAALIKQLRPDATVLLHTFGSPKALTSDNDRRLFGISGGTYRNSEDFITCFPPSASLQEAAGLNPIYGFTTLLSSSNRNDWASYVNLTNMVILSREGTIFNPETYNEFGAYRAAVLDTLRRGFSLTRIDAVFGGPSVPLIPAHELDEYERRLILLLRQLDEQVEGQNVGLEARPIIYNLQVIEQPRIVYVALPAQQIIREVKAKLSRLPLDTEIGESMPGESKQFEIQVVRIPGNKHAAYWMDRAIAEFPSRAQAKKFARNLTHSINILGKASSFTQDKMVSSFTEYLVNGQGELGQQNGFQYPFPVSD